MLLIVVLVVIYCSVTHSPREYKDITVEVYPGTTMWSIAEQYIGPKETLDEVVYRIKEKNPGVNPGSLQPGQKVIVPVLVEK